MMERVRPETARPSTRPQAPAPGPHEQLGATSCNSGSFWLLVAGYWLGLESKVPCFESRQNLLGEHRAAVSFGPFLGLLRGRAFHVICWHLKHPTGRLAFDDASRPRFVVGTLR